MDGQSCNLLITGGYFQLNSPQTEQKAIECVFNYFNLCICVLMSIKVIVSSLRDHYISSATHDTCDILDYPRCHPGTRGSLLERLLTWVKDIDSPIYMCWLYGPAGAGKSAIARSLAEILQSESLLTGSFFFLRMDSKRNSEKALVTTLAQQLAHSVPEIGPYLVMSMVKDSTILSRSFGTQFEELIVNPIVQITTDNYSTWRCALTFIIDGLDECENPKVRRLILKTICGAHPRLRGYVKFLITSRPEDDIQVFYEKTRGEHINRIELLSDPNDVRLYFYDEFDRIKREHTLRATFSQNWPPEDALVKLVENSSGHFIYASTVIKYIENACDRPQKRLEDIINLRSSQNSYEELDGLYNNILSSSRADRMLLVNIFSILLLCGSIDDPYLGDCRAPKNIAKHDRFVESVLSLEAGDVQLALLDLKSLIGLGKPLNIPSKHPRANFDSHRAIAYPDIRVIEFFHKSFSDFLLDPTRSKEFYIDTELACGLVTKGILRLLLNDSNMVEK